MGRLPTNNRKYEIAKLQDRHREILRRLALGQTPKMISNELGCTPAMINYTRRSAIGKREISLIHGARNGDSITVFKQIQDTAPEALELLKKRIQQGLLKEEPDNVDIKTAISVLDRGGYGPIRKTLNANVDEGKGFDKALEKIKAQAKKAGVLVMNGNSIDAQSDDIQDIELCSDSEHSDN